MSLKDALVANKPREISGSSSANRFQFQKDWAICKLLEMQMNDEEYVLIMDFHEDILIIDSDIAPQIAKFFQLKTKSNGNWTLNSLITSTKGKNSHLGKLYHNKMIFPVNNIELNFVSNAHYKLKLKNENSEDACLRYRDICLNQLDYEPLKKITKKIKDEFILKDEPQFKDITYMRVTELDIHSREPYTKGKVAEFFDAIDKGTKVNPAAVYRMLSNEIAKRNDYEWKIQSFGDIITYKGISKSTFTGFLNDLIRHSQVYCDWQNIEPNLLANGSGLREIKAIKDKWKTYEIERLSIKSNPTLNGIRERIIDILETIEDDSNYKILMESTFTEYSKRYEIFPVLYDEYYIKAIILMEFCL
ncbi:dsDNA nuclease domain-containing protein [Geosporobacter ferrireducens]|uniref:CD-NTase associated protein 4-like DNA endonuclease domain-containing protein n=1 Tax=Geosporobacter ferrireducens TaxID=1424294 RepID=A0A1D8GPB3_9FIRM|nr:dsDNA nuclease domain-containing protein [Geosporobacter ferrireducens]AOT72790.1 hypothetical protein Gferi_26475 [Geosporobacter ferrireducens]